MPSLADPFVRWVLSQAAGQGSPSIGRLLAIKPAGWAGWLRFESVVGRWVGRGGQVPQRCVCGGRQAHFLVQPGRHHEGGAPQAARLPQVHHPCPAHPAAESKAEGMSKHWPAFGLASSACRDIPH